MWQAMLFSAGLPNTKQIIIHGFITSNGQKMSKSLGNVIDPFEMVKKYGTDALRYFLLKEIPPFEDGDFTVDKFIKTYNADLANGLGNLVARVAKLAERSGLGNLQIKEDSTTNNVNSLIERFEFNKALEFIFTYVSGLDKWINNERPWQKTGSEQKKTLGKIIIGIESGESILAIANLLKPFLPKTAEIIEKQFTAPKIVSQKTLFPRIV